MLGWFLERTTSHAATVALNPVADTTLFEPNPDNNLGGNETGAIGATAEGKAARMLFRFDIAGSIPAGATITSGALDLTVTRFHVEDSITVQLHRMLRPWGEGIGGAGEATGPGGLGAAGEATWKVRTGPGTAWSAPGAAAPVDFLAGVSSSTSIGGADVYTVASTPSLVADLQSWLDKPAVNFGWIAISASESATGTAKRVGARESTDAAPVLTITYETGPVATKPTITGHPQSMTVVAGNTASFSVIHDGTPPFTYQWRRNGDPIATGTGPTYTIPAASAADEGAYTVVVQNAAGSATSDPAQLTVVPPPLVIRLAPVADTALFEVNPDRNYGVSAALRAGSTAQGKRARTLLRFDLQGALPPDAVITNAVLSLSVVKAPSGGGSTSVFGLHRVHSPWVEGSHDDTDAGVGEATWNRRAAPATSWGTPGGSAGADFEAAASATASIAGINRYAFGPGSTLVDDLQTWVSNPVSNLGWMLMTESEGTPQTAREFASRESATGQPELRIEYTRVGEEEAPRFESIAREADRLTLRIAKGVSLVVVLESSALPGGAEWKAVTTFDAGAAPESLAFTAPVGPDGNAFYRLRVTGRKT